MHHNRYCSNKGISVIEVLVGASLLVLSFLAVMGVVSLSLTQSLLIDQNAQAFALAQDALEAVRAFRDQTEWNANDINNQYDGLGMLQTGIPQHPGLSQDNPPRWQMIAGQEQVGMFARSIVFENALRDGNQNIVQSGGTADPNAKKITAAVSWTERSRMHQVVLEMYLTNWRQ